RERDVPLSQKSRWGLLADDQQPAFARFDRNAVAGRKMPRGLEIPDLRRFDGGMCGVDAERLPINSQSYRRILRGPGGKRYQCRAGLFKYCRGYLARTRSYRAVRAPVADHLCSLHAKVVPGFPDRPGVSVVGPGHAVRHAIDHTAPGVAAALEHFAHEAKGDAADLREEEIGGVLF